MIIAIGYRVKSQVATRFRQWAHSDCMNISKKALRWMMSVSKETEIDAGTISHRQAIEKATREFEEYRRKEMLQYESDFDRAIRELKSQAEGSSKASE